MSIRNPTLIKLLGTLAAAVSSAGSDERTFVIGDPKAVSADLTIPANVRLRFQDDGVLEIATGVTVTIESPGHVDADPVTQIFECTGTGKVEFDTGGVVYPGWWGAVPDGSTDNSTALQACNDAIETAGGVIQFGSGTYIGELTCSCVTAKVWIKGLGGSTILQAAAAGHYAITLDTGQNYNSRVITGIRFEGDSRTKSGILLAQGSEASSATIRDCTFNLCLHGIKKTGALFNLIDRCHFRLCDYGIHSEYQTVVDPTTTMHNGCDLVRNCAFAWAYVAGIFIDGLGGTPDMVKIEDCYYQNCHGFGIYVTDFATGAQRGLVLDTLWLENNNGNANTTIDGASRTTRDIFLDNVGKAVILNTTLRELEITDSDVVTYNCSITDDTVIEDNGGGVLQHNYVRGVVSNSGRMAHRTRDFTWAPAAAAAKSIAVNADHKAMVTASLTNLLTKGSCADDFTMNSANGHTYSFLEGDGLLFNRCLLVEFGASEGATGGCVPFPSFSITSGKFYAFSVALRGDSADGALSIRFGSSGLIFAGTALPYLADGWRTYVGVGCAKVTMSDNLYFYNNEAAAADVRISSCQVVEFDTKQEAIDYANGTAYALSADVPRIRYDGAAPTTGTWRVGDMTYDMGVDAVGQVGWVCTTGGAPGTWCRFGQVNSVTTGITAVNPGGQGDGALTSRINEVDTVGAANDAVTLPAAAAGRECIVINNGAETLEIWPASGDDCGGGVNTAITLASGETVRLVAYDATTWAEV